MNLVNDRFLVPDINKPLPTLPSTVSLDGQSVHSFVSIIDESKRDHQEDEISKDFLEKAAKDRLDPHNWPSGPKRQCLLMVALLTLITPLSFSIFAPSLPTVMSEFKSTNDELGTFTVSVFVLGYAFGPLLLAPMSEIIGRSPVYHVSNILFLIFTVACALSKNISMLIGFRFLQGCVGGTPLVIGSGSISDLVAPQNRAQAMALWSLGPMLGPVIGPLAGGYLADAVGWRWDFWICAIAGGVVTIAAILLLRETYLPVLLARQRRRKESWAGQSSIFLSNVIARSVQDIKLAWLVRNLTRPAKMLVSSRMVLILATLDALAYGYIYLLFTTIPSVFSITYQFNSGQVGLTYLGIFFGMLLGMVLVRVSFQIILNRESPSLAKDGNTKQPKLERRLIVMMPGAFFMSMGLFCYGWSTHHHSAWIVPVIGTSMVGFGLVCVLAPVNSYLVEAYRMHAASAMAAVNVLRALTGALLPLAGAKLYQSLGLGWGNSVLAFIALASMPIPGLLVVFGDRLRPLSEEA